MKLNQGPLLPTTRVLVCALGAPEPKAFFNGRFFGPRSGAKEYTAYDVEHTFPGGLTSQLFLVVLN